MHDCRKLRDDIWEAVEAGEIPGGLLIELRDCETCRRELTLARSATKGFGALRAVEAPDCSSAVMARIDSSARRGRAVWAYALGLVMVFAVVLAISRPRGPELSKNIAKGTDRHRVVPDRAVPNPKGYSKQIASGEDVYRIRQSPSSPRHERPVKHRWKASPPLKHSPIKEAEERMKISPPVRQPSKSSEPAAEQVSPPEDCEPQIAIIVMDEPPGQEDQSSEAVEYSYTRTDSETGDITECSAKRSGESIELYLEVKPGSKRTLIKGSLDHETENDI